MTSGWVSGGVGEYMAFSEDFSCQTFFFFFLFLFFFIHFPTFIPPSLPHTFTNYTAPLTSPALLPFLSYLAIFWFIPLPSTQTTRRILGFS
jgi:uncharacterized membrane protein